MTLGFQVQDIASIHVWGYCTATQENAMERKMEHDIETGVGCNGIEAGSVYGSSTTIVTCGEHCDGDACVRNTRLAPALGRFRTTYSISYQGYGRTPAWAHTLPETNMETHLALF